ncbi:hypothetical protein [Amycolatopsis sp. NPDC059657]|uniref:hypothetical protein n=1 Tax=Amycolatopsis sp. NPDC059657 TaxID=3346899 RepID=UPI003672B588
MTDYNPPAQLTWTQEAERLHVAEHDGVVWALVAHSVHRGKSGWSGTDEWNLHRAHPDPEDVEATIGDMSLDHGRWVAGPRKIAAAKRIAAWIATNSAAADRMVLDEIAAAAGVEGTVR